MPKRKKPSSKKQSKILINLAWVLTFVAIVLSLFIAGYYVGYDDAKKDVLKKDKQKISIVKKIEEVIHQKSEPSVNSRLKEVLKKESKICEDTQKKTTEYEDASHEIEGRVLPNPFEREVIKVSTKPKLAIIIDDVSVRSHVNAIKSLNLPITMSFLPPSKFRPNSNSLAEKESFYMVHLPMEAKNYSAEEPYTLRVDDSQKEISQRIAQIKKLFPRVKYINNHTGSRFTSDEKAVNRLIYALEKEKIEFIDSRTIASTKVPTVMKNYGKKYVSRDVFLDHEHDKEYIKEQIKKAVQTAKVHGTAIAIGHPQANTILAINESKELFEDIELVLIERLY